MQYAQAPPNQIPVPAAGVYSNIYGNKIGGNGLRFTSLTIPSGSVSWVSQPQFFTLLGNRCLFLCILSALLPNLKEQCIWAKFCFKIGTSASQTHEMLTWPLSVRTITRPNFWVVFSIKTWQNFMYASTLSLHRMHRRSTKSKQKKKK